MVPPLAYFASGGSYPMIRMMKSEWFPLLPILPVGELSHDQNDEIGMIPLLPILPVGELSNDQNDEIGIVPPLAHFQIGGNYPMIKMMKSE